MFPQSQILARRNNSRDALKGQNRKTNFAKYFGDMRYGEVIESGSFKRDCTVT